jgi:Tol biopolymer transport system component
MRGNGVDLGNVLPPDWVGWNGVWSPTTSDLIAFAGAPRKGGNPKQTGVPHIYTHRLGSSGTPVLVSRQYDARGIEHSDQHPAWSPEGDAIVFSTQQQIEWDLWIAPVNPTTGLPLREAAPLVQNDQKEDWLRPFWSSFGLIFTSVTPLGAPPDTGHIMRWQVNRVGTGATSTFSVVQSDRLTDGPDEQGFLTPDGTKLIYTHLTNGKHELYVDQIGASNAYSLTPGWDCSTAIVIP